MIRHIWMHLMFLVCLAFPFGAPADELQVGQRFPALRMLHVVDGAPRQLRSLEDVTTNKAIVFVFASW